MASHTLNDSQLPWPGDHIWVRHRAYGHHGLYLGEDQNGCGQVIHYSGWADGFASGPLEIVRLDCFQKGKKLHVRDYKYRPFSDDMVIERALSRLGETHYDVHSNNCEHFCTWAITGDTQSKQVDWVDTILGAIHPGLEASSKAISAARSPKSISTKGHRHTSYKIARDFAVDMGIKSAARWVIGPYGVAAYVGYRVAKQLLKDRAL